MPEEEIVVVFRTYLWDDVVAALFEHLTRSTNTRIVLCVDETHGPVAVPDGFEKVVHTCATFEAMGLPLLPSAENALWYCCDYPLYQLLNELTFSHVFMIEHDCAVTGPLDNVLKQLADERVDYASRSLRKVARTEPFIDTAWPWFRRHPKFTQVSSGSFNAIFISKAAVDEAFSARLEMARQYNSEPFKWVFGEPFLATQLLLSGHKCVRLKGYADMTMCTYEEALRLAEVTVSETDEVRFFHPVLSSPRYEQKLVSHFRRRSEELDTANNALKKKLQTTQDALELTKQELKASNKKLTATGRKLDAAKVDLRLTRLRMKFWRRSNWPAYFQALQRKIIGH